MPRKNQLGQFFVDVLRNPVAAFADSAPAVLSKKYPEIAAAMQVAKILATGSTNSNGPIQGDPVDCIRQLKSQKWGTPIICGMQGSGKSTFAVWLARQVGNKHNYTLMMPNEQIPPDFTKLNSIGDLFHIPKGSTVICDDVGQIGSIYTYSKAAGQPIIDLITMCRHYGLCLIIICQNTAAINRHWLDTVDMLFIKRPGISDEFERPALRKPYRRAQQQFYGKNQAWIWGHVYCWSQMGEGMIAYRPTEIR